MAGLNDELVIKVQDVTGNLSRINQAIKSIMHQENKKYHNAHHVDLYDAPFSERYTYIPHIGLGRLHSGAIKEHVKNFADFDRIFKRIQDRTKDATIEVIKSLLTTNNQKIIFNKFRLYHSQKRASSIEAEIKK